MGDNSPSKHFRRVTYLATSTAIFIRRGHVKADPREGPVQTEMTADYIGSTHITGHTRVLLTVIDLQR